MFVEHSKSPELADRTHVFHLESFQLTAVVQPVPYTHRDTNILIISVVHTQNRSCPIIWAYKKERLAAIICMILCTDMKFTRAEMLSSARYPLQPTEKHK